MPSKEYFSVSELNGLIKEVLTMGFPSSVWLCGEIQGYDRNRTKNHIFFELCEKDPVSKDILARIGLVIFSGRKTYIDEILRGAQNAFQLKDDIEVKFLCKIDFYPPHGAVRLIVEAIDPTYTLGKIAQEKQRLIALLRDKGVLDKNKKVAFPTVPLRIGLITAFDSAAYNDFLSELQLSGYGFKIFLRNTLMQGKSASHDVAKAIAEFNAFKELDTIVITRGGGSLAELSCFDSQEIAEMIAASDLPVLSGIGHEINITITDLAAHTYQKTPTAIAKFLVNQVEGFLKSVEERVKTVVELTETKLADEKTHLKDIAIHFRDHTAHYFKDHHERLNRFKECLKKSPLQFLSNISENIKREEDRFLKSSDVRLKAEHLRLKNFDRLISMAGPEKILQRGFTITRRKSGGLLRSAKNIDKGEILVTELADGKIESEFLKGGQRGGN